MNIKFRALALAVLMTVSFFAPGCTGTAKDNNVNEKVFTYGTVAYGPAMETTSTDPHNSYDGWAAIRYGAGETLFKFSDKMQLEPWIADSYEQIDDNTVKVLINDKATFSNGKKVTGEAVKTCLEDLISRHDRAPQDLKIESITANGQYVIIKSAEKMPALLHYLSDPYGCIIDTEAGIKDGIAIGTGPYKASKVTETQIELVKNDNYWGPVKPKMDKVIVRSITDGDMLAMAMQNGEFDAVQGLPYSSLELFKNDAARYKISQTDTSRVYQAAFNFKTASLQDLRVRQAICMAIDKKNFAKVLLSGNGTETAGPFPGNLSFGGNAVTSVPYNLERAKSLLAEAGYADTDNDGYVDKNGKNLELRYLTYTSRQELPLLAEFAQASLKEIGIKLNVNATDNYRAFLKKGEYDIFSKAIVTAPTGDPEYYFTSHILKNAPDNSGFYCSPAIENMETDLRNTFGDDKRSAIAISMAQQVLNDCALIYVAHLKMSLVMKPNIEGFAAHPSDYYEICPELDKL